MRQLILARNAKYSHDARMPFKSSAQRRKLFATNPAVAKKFAAETPKGKKLPEKVHPAMKQATASFMKYHGPRPKK